MKRHSNRTSTRRAPEDSQQPRNQTLNVSSYPVSHNPHLNPWKKAPSHRTASVIGTKLARRTLLTHVAGLIGLLVWVCGRDGMGWVVVCMVAVLMFWGSALKIDR